MIPASVRYARASDLEHALELLGEPEAKALAGGHSLLPVMKLRIARPELVVDISRLDLRRIDLLGDEVRIGALTTWSELHDAIALHGLGMTALLECAEGIGDLQVRNRGTIGGSIAHADPASDVPAVLLALGATLTLRSVSSERHVALSDFLLGPFTTALADQELITDIAVPVPPRASGSAYVSVEHPASGFALAGAAALVGPGGEAMLAVTGVAGTPLLLPAGADPAEALAELDVFGDRYAPADYRRHLAVTCALRALDTARLRAEEDSP